MFDGAFFDKPKNLVCDLSLMRLGKKKKKKEKVEKLRQFICIFRKQIIFKVMKTISYKMKNLNRYVWLLKGSARELIYSEFVLRLQKERPI